MLLTAAFGTPYIIAIAISTSILLIAAFAISARALFIGGYFYLLVTNQVLTCML